MGEAKAKITLARGKIGNVRVRRAGAVAGSGGGGEGSSAPASAHAHDHSHAHSHEPAPLRPTTHVACEGAPAAQFDIERLLPGETDDQGRFAELARALSRVPEVGHVHLVRAEVISVCVHHGRAEADALAAEVLEIGEAVAKRYRARMWMVRGMDSAQCAAMIEHALNRTTGVLEGSVAYASERLVVEYDAELVSEADIERRVEALGYALEDPPAGHVCAFHGSGEGLAPKLGPWLVGASGVLIGAGLAVEQFAVGGEKAALVATIAYALALGCAGWFPAKGAIAALRQFRADVETLTVLAAIGAGALGAWFEGAFLLFLFSLGHSLEHRAMERARRAVEALATLRPDVARVRRGGAVAEIPAAKVRIGDIVLVRPGDRVPLDGEIVDGESHLDEAALTGESVPVAKKAGDPVLAGAINQDGALEVRATKLAGDSTLARLVDMVAAAEARKSPDQRFTAKIERRVVPVVLALAPLLTVGLAVTGMPVRDAVLRGLALLVAASPCALAVATPSAVLSAVARAARGGVLIKGGSDLHALGSVRALAFDKTGTLTVGKPRLVEVHGADERLLLAVAAGAESLSGHPIAQAVLAGAAERGIEPERGEDLVAVHGQGIRGTVGGRDVQVGRPSWIAGLPAEIVVVCAEMEARGRTTLVVARDGVVLGALGVADTLRPEAREALAHLGRLGLDRTVMLSGDNARAAAAIAKEVGITEARAPLLPEQKVSELRALSRHGGVAMVGDGVNDAPALAAASVGVSLGGAGSDVALQTADIVLMGDDLRKLPFAVDLARAANETVKVNIGIALGVAGILVAASALGFVGISHAVILHEGSTLVVVLNGLRLLGFRGRA